MITNFPSLSAEMRQRINTYHESGYSATRTVECSADIGQNCGEVWQLSLHPIKTKNHRACVIHERQDASQPPVPPVKPGDYRPPLLEEALYH